MDNEKEFPKRKRNRLENYDYSSCGAYFITVCTLERQNYFWENVGAIIDRPQVCSDEYGRPLVAPTMSRVVKQRRNRR